MQEIASQRFLMQLGVENNILKAYQNPSIRKLLNGGVGKKGDFRILLRMNNYCFTPKLQFGKSQQNDCLRRAMLYTEVFNKKIKVMTSHLS